MGDQSQMIQQIRIIFFWLIRKICRNLASGQTCNHPAFVYSLIFLAKELSLRTLFPSHIQSIKLDLIRRTHLAMCFYKGQPKNHLKSKNIIEPLVFASLGKASSQVCHPTSSQIFRYPFFDPQPFDNFNEQKSNTRGDTSNVQSLCITQTEHYCSKHRSSSSTNVDGQTDGHFVSEETRH